MSGIDLAPSAAIVNVRLEANSPFGARNEDASRERFERAASGEN